MKSVIVALALGTGNAYVTPLKPVHTRLSKLSMQSGVGDLYNSKGVSASASTTTVEEVVAEDEVIDLKPEAVEAVVVGEEKAEEPKAEAPKAAEPAVENTRATLVGNASRDPGALVFHRNKEQKYATVYTEMEKFFPGVCPELPRPALLDGTLDRSRTAPSGCTRAAARCRAAVAARPRCSPPPALAPASTLTPRRAAALFNASARRGNGPTDTTRTRTCDMSEMQTKKLAYRV